MVTSMADFAARPHLPGGPHIDPGGFQISAGSLAAHTGGLLDPSTDLTIPNYLSRANRPLYFPVTRSAL